MMMMMIVAVVLPRRIATSLLYQIVTDDLIG